MIDLKKIKERRAALYRDQMGRVAGDLDLLIGEVERLEIENSLMVPMLHARGLDMPTAIMVEEHSRILAQRNDAWELLAKVRRIVIPCITEKEGE